MIKNANPFDMLFDAPYGMSVIPSVVDMIDSTIGVMESSTYQELASAPTMGTFDSEVQDGYVFIHRDAHGSRKPAARGCT
jgi:hypothetical protein